MQVSNIVIQIYNYNLSGYLNNIDETLADSNVDFYHIFHAYKAIDEWFNAQPDSVVAADDIYGYLVKFVKIIWYEVGEDEDAISLFTRLNIGKIPLTSAELVKAIFLSRDNSTKMDKEKQEEISLQWDSRLCRAIFCSLGDINCILGKIVIASPPLCTPSRL